MVVYGTYKQISRYEGLHFLLSHVSKTIDDNASHFNCPMKDQKAYDTIDDELMMIKQDVEVEEYVFA